LGEKEVLKNWVAYYNYALNFIYSYQDFELKDIKRLYLLAAIRGRENLEELNILFKSLFYEERIADRLKITANWARLFLNSDRWLSKEIKSKFFNINSESMIKREDYFKYITSQSTFDSLRAELIEETFKEKAYKRPLEGDRLILKMKKGKPIKIIFSRLSDIFYPEFLEGIVNGTRQRVPWTDIDTMEKDFDTLEDFNLGLSGIQKGDILNIKLNNLQEKVVFSHLSHPTYPFFLYAYVGSELETFRISDIQAIQKVKPGDSEKELGGIDLRRDTLPLETRGSGVNFDTPLDKAGLPCIDTDGDGICEKLDIQRLEDIRGVSPDIFSIIPLQNLKSFLGAAH